MAFRTQDKRIGETLYRVTELPATRSLDMLIGLFKMIGPALGVVMDGVDTAKRTSLADMLDAKLSGDAFARAAAELAARVNTPQVQDMIAKLRACTQYDPGGQGETFRNMTAETFDMHFAGRMHELFGWLAFALEVQFGDFFGSLASLGGASPAGAPAPQAAS